MAACTTVTQYSSYAACVAICAAFPTTGSVTPLDTISDTVQCRNYHALVAPADQTTHCPHAGPSGGGQCGTTCDGYCDIIQLACGTTGTNSQYASTSACLTSCAAMTAGTFGDTTGNTLACRAYHAGVALSSGLATTHCPHAGPTGGSSTYCGASGSSSSSTMTSSTGTSMAGSGATNVQASFALIVSLAAIAIISKQL